MIRWLKAWWMRRRTLRLALRLALSGTRAGMAEWMRMRSNVDSNNTCRGCGYCDDCLIGRPARRVSLRARFRLHRERVARGEWVAQACRERDARHRASR